MNDSPLSPEASLVDLVRRELLRLARLEDQLACEEASRVPYWAPCPDSVSGHRVAARLLHAHADELLAG